MTDVIKFNPPPAKNSPSPPEGHEPTEFIYLCGNCDCRTFNLLASGTIICSSCDTPVKTEDRNDERWRQVIKTMEPQNPETITESDSGTLNVNMYADASLARRGTLKRIAQWEEGKELVMVGAYAVDGAGRHWFDVVTEDQRQWVLARLADLMAHVNSMKVDGTQEVLNTTTDPTTSNDD